MRIWALAVGAVAVLVVQAPSLSRSVSFERCATAAPATIETTGTGELIARTEIGGQSVRFPSDSEMARPGEGVIAYSCGAGSSMHSLRPPREHTLRALKLALVGMIVFGPIVAFLVRVREGLMSRGGIEAKPKTEPSEGKLAP
jgi:hypothetical protein